jgi:hypothetical protein
MDVPAVTVCDSVAGSAPANGREYVTRAGTTTSFCADMQLDIERGAGQT